jgi:hypothetical protein
MPRCRFFPITRRVCGFILLAAAGLATAACSRTPSPDADIEISFVVNPDGSLSPRSSFVLPASSELSQVSSGTAMTFPQSAISLTVMSQCGKRIMVGATEMDGQSYAIVLIPQESHEATIELRLGGCP